jgi:O-antigen/teichoic acid export membrane protein
VKKEVEGLVERGKDDEDVKMGVQWVAPFRLVVVIVSALILAALIFYIYHEDTLAIIAVLLLLVFALSLRTIQFIKAFRPRGKQSQNTILNSVWVWEEK